MRKPESYLMVGICDGYDLWFAGKRVENGAFVSVSVFGSVNSAESEKMTAAVCDLLGKVAGLDGEQIYVTYTGVRDWGFDGGNF
ncbi:MAG: phenylpyruvate tautomerase MIF-related protein [Candidatus Coproplasma sp.]